MFKAKHFIAFSILTVLLSCGRSQATSGSSPGADSGASLTSREFNSDSAYAYVKSQTDMGPRNPGSAGHKRMQEWLVTKLGSFNPDTVIQQKATVTGPDGKPLPINNILARYNNDASRRVVLLAHYDTRPWADAEPDKSKHNTPIDGANDGGSGVGVLLEIARNLKEQSPDVGVDLLFVDAEDSGKSDDSDPLSDYTWCLGSQYWSRHLPYPAGGLPEGAILLDMVGGKDAVFRKEYFSQQYAPQLVEKVWDIALKSGYGERFKNDAGGAINDDHLALLRAGIPTIDIIESMHPETGTFNPTWHTLDDNIANIDANTLKAVGQTVLNVIYNW